MTQLRLEPEDETWQMADSNNFHRNVNHSKETSTLNSSDNSFNLMFYPKLLNVCDFLYAALYPIVILSH